MSDDILHKVKSHIWRNGKLTVFEHFFDKFVDALNYTRQADVHSSKIYGPGGVLLHSASITAPAQEQTYA
jgi:hypothetical protein